MTYLRGMLSGIAAIFVVLLGPGLLFAFSQQKATGLGVVHGALIENLVSPRFWILTILLSCLFFAASRLSSKVLRVLLFWTPTLVISALGFGFVPSSHISGLISETGFLTESESRWLTRPL
jgi:hypothetical protein